VPRRGSAGLGSLLGLALPVLALAAGMDLQGGTTLPTVVLETCAAAGFLAALGHAAGGGDRRGQYVWLALVVGLPICAATLAWNDAPGGGIRWLGTAAAISPLEWAFARADGGARPVWHDVLAPAALVLVLVGLRGRTP